MAVAATSADAAVVITGGGVWTAGTVTSARTKSLSSFEFSFEILNPLIVSGGVATASDFDDFSYFLNGTSIVGDLLQIRFYPSSADGLFDLVFSDETLSFFGADIGSDGTLSLGSYGFTAGYGTRIPTGIGGVTISAIPDAQTWAMMIVGAGAIGGAMRARRRIKATVSFA